MTWWFDPHDPMCWAFIILCLICAIIVIRHTV